MEPLPINVKDWSIGDVSNWLKINNLEKIIDSFKKSEIKGNSLLKIKEKDFSELGILDILSMKEGDKLVGLLENLNINEVGPSFNFNLNDYELEYENEIGSGSFGKVYKVTKKSDKTNIKAVKKIMKSNKKEYMDIIENEKNILKSLDHPNIIKICGYCEDDNFVYFLMEYIPYSIKDYYNKNQFSIDEIRIATKSLLEGLVYIHKNGYVHRDLKCKNILINEKFQTKIIDFGLSCMFDDAKGSNFETVVGTSEFLAPELFFKRTYEFGTSCDIWALGCVVLEMYFRGDFWNGEKPFKKNIHPSIPSEVSNYFQDFLKCCFHVKPSFRPTAEKLLSHPWILGEPELFEIIPIEKILLSEYEMYGGNYYINGGIEVCLTRYSYDEYIKSRDIENLKIIQNDGDETESKMLSTFLEDIIYLKIGHYILPLTKEIKSKIEPLKKKYLNLNWRNQTKEKNPTLNEYQIFLISSLLILEYFSYYLVFKYSKNFNKSKTFFKNYELELNILVFKSYFDRILEKNK